MRFKTRLYGTMYKNIWIPELVLTMKKEGVNINDKFACGIHLRVAFISLPVDSGRRHLFKGGI